MYTHDTQTHTRAFRPHCRRTISYTRIQPMFFLNQIALSSTSAAHLTVQPLTPKSIHDRPLARRKRYVPAGNSCGQTIPHVIYCAVPTYNVFQLQFTNFYFYYYELWVIISITYIYTIYVKLKGVKVKNKLETACWWWMHDL